MDKHMHISRRSLLKEMGVGLMGSAFMSRPAWGRPAPGLNMDASPDLLWQEPLPAGYSMYSSPTYVNGSVILNLRNKSDYHSSLFWLDIQTKQYYRGPVTPGGRSYELFADIPVLFNNVLYIPYVNGGLFALDPNTVQTLWSNKDYRLAGSTSLGNSSVSFLNKKIVFLTVGGQIVALGPNGDSLWSYSTGESALRATLAISIDGTILGAFNETVYAVDSSGNFLWKFSDAAGGAIHGLASGNGNVYVTTGTALYAVNAATGKLSWKISTPLMSAPPVFYTNQVYIALTTGDFQAYQPDNGTKQWDVNLGTRTSSDFFIEDGVAYLGSGGPKLYAVDLKSEGKQVVSYAPNFTAILIGVENGVCYFSNLAQTTIYAVDLGHQVHQYCCESQLMADDYVSSGSTQTGYQPSSTWYRTQIQLQDSASVPRNNKSIKIAVSDAATIMTDEQTYQVTPDAPLWLTTDGAGQLSLAVQATDLTCPSLSLWGNFMDPQEAIVIYPDHDTNNTLSQVQGSDLSAATTYDGSTMLPKGYSTADALASSIQQTMGSVPVSLLGSQFPHRKKLTAAQTKYVAYPDTSANMIYQPIAGSTARRYTPGNAQAWTLQIDSSGTASYTLGVALPKHLLTGPLSDFKTFAHNVVHGGEKIASMRWQVIKNEAQAVIHTVENDYHLAVTAAEHAITIAAGVLKTIIGDIKQALEWLSHIMNWGDIKKTKEQITAVFNGWLTSMQTQSGDVLKQIQATVDKALLNAISDVQGVTNFALKALGTTSIQSNQVAHNDPLAIVGTGVKHWYSSMHWLISKFTDNLPKHSMSTAMPDSYAPFLQTCDNLIQTVEQKITQDPALADLSNVFSNFLTHLGSFFSDPAQAIKGQIADIVKLIGDVVLLLLKAIKVAIDTILETLPSLFAAIKDLLNQEMHVFGISELWKVISGEALTLLDLGALLIAVPASIIQNATGVKSSAAYPGQVPTLLGDSWPYFCVTVVNTVFTAIQDFMGMGYFITLQSVQVVLMGLQTAFLAPPALQDIWAYPTFYVSFLGRVVLWITSAYVAIKEQVTQVSGASPIVPTISSLAGIMMSWMALADLLVNDSVPMDTRLKESIASICESMGLIFKPLKIDEMATPATMALAGIDVVFGWTAAGLRVSLWA